MKFARMNFPEIGPAHDSKPEISEKYLTQKSEFGFRKSFWMYFPGLPIRLNEFCNVACKLLWPLFTVLANF